MYCNALSATIASRFLPSWEAAGPSNIRLNSAARGRSALSSLFDAGLVFSLGVAWLRLRRGQQLAQAARRRFYLRPLWQSVASD